MERAESEVTPVFIALPLNDDGAKAEVEAARAERRKATVFMVVVIWMFLTCKIKKLYFVRDLTLEKKIGFKKR
jgi:hypothetical protein